MRTVLDTNVLVSGLLGIYTYPARVIDLVYIGRLQCIYDDRIMTEYKQVLARSKFRQAINEKERRDLLGYLAHNGVHVLAEPLESSMTASAQDPNDIPFAEVAVSGTADCIITGNHAHFAFFFSNPWAIKILSPRDCYNLLCNHHPDSE